MARWIRILLLPPLVLGQQKSQQREGGVAEWLRALDLKSGGPRFKSFTLQLNGFVLGSPELNSSVAVCKQLTGLPLTSWDSQQVYVASEVFVSRFKVSPISMYVLNTMALTEIN